MTKKKTGAKKNESSIKGASANSPIKPGKETEGTENEILGVHVINRQDVESHFGTSETKTDGKSGQPTAQSPKTDVNLELDEQIWQRAQASAEEAGLEVSEYVEQALEKFMQDSAK